MNWSQYTNVYFLGIGGIGMSALARYAIRCGKKVAGYDKTETELTKTLVSEGMQIHYEDAIGLIPNEFLDSEKTVVVRTPAIPADHSEWKYFQEKNFHIIKRAELLGAFSEEPYCFAIAGTHGKTTTTAILGHLLVSAQVEVTAFCGGIVEPYKSNLLGTGTDVIVVEADEFDRSFLHLYPNSAGLTSLDADHLDIYHDAQAVVSAFQEFANKVDASKRFVPFGMPIEGKTLGIEPQKADYTIVNVKHLNGIAHFDIQTPTKTITEIQFALPGEHNLRNALMATAMALDYGISDEKIRIGLKSFEGIQRRFSVRFETQKFAYIDDYAHHPTEIMAVYNALRERYAGKKIAVVFQPHLFSRTRDFADDFAKALSLFDHIMLMPIYPARELPIEGITSKWLLDKINNENKKISLFETLLSDLQNTHTDVWVTLGAGDISNAVAEIENYCKTTKTSEL
jgi:UDP-N-acetylmuramate--alanine ligase